MDKTQEHLHDALAAGARLLFGGDRVDPEGTARGNFISPAVVDHVPASARIAHEETFGPAVAVLRAKSAADAIAMANNSDYGLAAYLFTGDVERGQEMARQLQFGGVGVNINDITELDAPFGGWKMSGFGRDLGVEGLQGMTQAQHVRTLLG
jgi:succinate-semialdehyde dehydrogenase/glutarate-semialdehyde dehydrogenase